MRISIVAILALALGHTQAQTANTPNIPAPTLTKDFHLECDLNPKLNLGVGPAGSTFNWISFTGGRWNATWGNGTIELGGHDYQYVLPQLAAKLDTRYLLKTADCTPGYIEIKTNGWRTGSPEVLALLNDPATADSVDPSRYKFRLYVAMNTNDERYNWVNTTMWVASGMRKGNKVIYDAYRVA